jgi:beta-glucosidase
MALCAAAVLVVLPGVAHAQGRCGSYTWCNTSLTPGARAQLMLAAMSQPDKVGILTGQAASDVGLPAMQWTDGSLGAGGLGSGSSGATAMPATIALAANFDPAMARDYGAVVGQEVKHRGFDGDFGPTVINMRTPLAGRTFQAYGEDPYLSAQNAVGWVNGLQAQGVMANVNIFAANNQEGQMGVSPLFGTVGGRSYVNVRVDPRTLHEIEFVPFEAAVTQAHSATVMCSYNQVNGAYSCANPFLLTDTLRGLWGFDGFVVSDAAACHEADQNLNAGMNYDIVGTCYNAAEVNVALAAGLSTQATLDRRVYEIAKTLFAHGFFDHPIWPKDITQDNQAADQAVADRAERGGEVLLRNDGSLPLDPSKVRSLAVIGLPANQYIFGHGSSEVTPYATTTALQGITARAAQAGIRVSYDDGTNPVSAQALARSSDAAIVVAADSESEGTDRACLSLVPACSISGRNPNTPSLTAEQLAYGDQDAVIARTAAVNPHTIVVLETGAPVLTPWRNSIAALLEAWYPGQDGGTEIAHVLFGDADPGGRLPATFPQRESDIPTAAGGPRAYPGVLDPTSPCKLDSQLVPCPWWQENYSEGVMVGYRSYDQRGVAPAYPFGFGLSYTSFAYRGFRIVGDDVSATVVNTGARAGVAVPQLYVSLPSLPGVPEPPRQLAAFTKISLAPGEAARFTLHLTPRSFSYWDDGSSSWRIAPGCDGVAVGGSSRDLPLQGPIAVGGGACKPGP